VVSREANKIQIKNAVQEKYNVTVQKVRTQIYGSERKTKFTKRGVQRTKTNIKKKAIVDIQDGESIDFYNNL
jgi:large subunit ribosomal protein L23